MKMRSCRRRNYLCSLGKDDFEGEVVDDHVVKDVVEEPHVEDKLVGLVEEVLVGGHAVAQHVVRLPAAEEREPGTQVDLDRVVQHAKRRRRNVANVVTVVHVVGCKGNRNTP